MIPAFKLHRPTSVAEAVRLAAELGADARLYAGGTELLLVLREGFLEADHLIDIKRIPALEGVRLDQDDRFVRIGATTVHTDIERSDIVRKRIPALAALESKVANVRVRNTGTLGGNLCFAEPHGDPATLLLAADAQVVLTGPRGSRTTPLDGWIRGPFEVDLAPDEMLTEILIPIPTAAGGLAYQRFRALERPSVAVAVRIEIGSDGTFAVGRVVAGCAGPRPQRLLAAESELLGGRIEDIDRLAASVANAAAEEAEVDADAYGPADHKRQLIRVMTRRALIEVAGGIQAGSAA